jgi:hypothetical protein
MTLGRKDFSVTRTDGGAHVFGLAGFLSDDELISHSGSLAQQQNNGSRRATRRAVRAGWCGFAAELLSTAPSRIAVAIIRKRSDVP